MSKFCYFDHCVATDAILSAARYFLNKPFPDGSDVNLCSGLLHAYRLVREQKTALAEQVTPQAPKTDTTAEDMVEAFGA